jgi:hypothetical protein
MQKDDYCNNIRKLVDIFSEHHVVVLTEILMDDFESERQALICKFIRIKLC